MKMMPRMLFSPLFLLLGVLVVTPPSVVVVNAADCKACLFDGNDPDTCIVYGKLGDQVVEWNTGARECKGYYNIAINGINPETSCTGGSNAFVNSLRFGDLQNSDSKLGLGVGSEGGAFFVQNPQANNRIDLAPTIIIDGKTSNCETNKGSCFNAMKPYFENDSAGKQEMQDVCNTLYNKVRVDRNLEESVLRNRLCMEHKNGTLIPIGCDPLAQQVKDQIKANPDRDCSGYGFESPLSTIPGCEKVLDQFTSDGSAGSREVGGGGGGGGTLSSSSSTAWWKGLTTTITSGGFALFLARL